MRDIRALLNDLSMEQYGEIFEKEQVDGKMLKDLDEEVLQSHFKMVDFHARKLVKAARENWRPAISN